MRTISLDFPDALPPSPSTHGELGLEHVPDLGEGGAVFALVLVVLHSTQIARGVGPN